MTLEGLYHYWIEERIVATSYHLPTLRTYAEVASRGVEKAVVAEFGVKHGASSVALLMGCAGEVHSWDIVQTPKAAELQKVAGPRWHFHLEDSRRGTLPDNCQLLFVDSLHNYEQTRAELERHAAQVRRFLIFHDIITFGSFGARDESGRWDKEVLGIMPAILELMVRDPSWVVRFVSKLSHGLLVLERRQDGHGS